MADDDNEQRDSLLPGLAGMAAYEGLPIISAPLLSAAPHGLAQLVMSGRPIESSFGTPISRLAEFTRSEVNSIRNFAAQQGVKIPIVAAGSGVESGYMFDQPGPLRQILQRLAGEPVADVAPHIALRTSSVPHALHEIGHATPIAGSETARRTFQSLAKTMGLGSSIGNLVRAGLAAQSLLPPGDDASDARRFMHEHAPALVGATLAPELAEEARASYHALRGSRQYGPGRLRALVELAPAFGTYLAAAAAPVLATILAKRVAESLRGEPKTAAMAGAEVKAPGALRTPASAAWRMGASPPKPKTIGPAHELGTLGKGRAPAKPPSNTSFYKDILESLYNPQRGYRLAKAG